MKTLRKAKVICLSVAGHPGNTIYRQGQTVTEKQFPNGLFDKQIADKYIEEIFDEKKPDEDSSDSNKTPNLFDTETDKKAVSSEEKSIDDISEGKLKKELRKAKIEFSSDATKEELFALFQGIGK